MKKRTWFMLSISTLVIALAVPLMAQTFMLKANVPFEFTVGNKVMPAGEYLVKSDAGSSAVLFQGETNHAAAVSLMFRKELRRTEDPASSTELTFNRYGDRYFLSEVNNGYTGTGFAVPMSHTQQELSKTASLRHEEIVAVLAQR